MSVDKKMRRVVMCFVLGVLCPVIVSMAVENSKDLHLVRGVIEHVADNTLTIKNKTYDVTGVPVLDIYGENIMKLGDAFRGKIAVIQYREGKPVSVKIFPHMNE